MNFEQNCHRVAAALLLIAALAGCAGGPHLPRLEEGGAAPLLSYHAALGKMTPAELAREKANWGSAPQQSANQLKLAMLLGQTRGASDLPRAVSLLEGVLKNNDAAQLHPLARLLLDNYNERLRLEAQFDKQGQQVKESQRKAAELQEKLDSLADIERTLPTRPRSGGKR